MEAVRGADRILAAILSLLVRAYQVTVSPMLGNRCRFYPGCSSYSRDALKLHGAAFGSFLTIRRLARCHPFHPGGFDPVPEIFPASRARKPQ